MTSYPQSLQFNSKTIPAAWHRAAVAFLALSFFALICFELLIISYQIHFTAKFAMATEAIYVLFSFAAALFGLGSLPPTAAACP